MLVLLSSREYDSACKVRYNRTHLKTKLLTWRVPVIIVRCDIGFAVLLVLLHDGGSVNNVHLVGTVFLAALAGIVASSKECANVD